MGMSASQARFLCLTARLSDNEMTQQNLTYSKQRLSDNSQMINDQYLEALNKTKYQVLTGYNGNEARYADITYNQITGYNGVAAGKQYLVKDNKGKVLVPSNVAAAFEYGNGDFNKFLAKLGYTQSNINVNSLDAEEKVHEAWDKYLSSVGQSIDNVEGKHILGFGFTSLGDEAFNGFVTYNTAYTQEEDGSIIQLHKDKDGYYKDNYKIITRETESGEIECGYWFGDNFWTLDGVNFNPETKKFTYDGFKDDDDNLIEYSVLYADRTNDENNGMIFESPVNRLEFNGTNYTSKSGVTYTITENSTPLNFEGTTTAQRELYDYAMAITEAYYNKTGSVASNLQYEPEMVNYYKNIFNEMRSKGYTTVEEKYNTVDSINANKKLNDAEWFVKQLKAGNLVLSYYSTAEKSFIGTTLDDDESITEKEDKSAIAIAEQVYKTAMDNLEHQDKQIDLQLNRLESEHNAIQTEIDAVQAVLKKNVESGFKTFNS